MNIGGPYSELEYLILAMIGDNVTSGYAIRKEMARMQGSRWSSESGSVYRVIARLVADGLVHQGKAAGHPRRERVEYELAPSGMVLLDMWLSTTPERHDFGFLVDPLRTRCYFLGRLPIEKQIRVVRQWLNESRIFVDELEAQSAKAPKHEVVSRNFAFENYIHLAQARQDWLKRLLKQLKSLGKPLKEASELLGDSVDSIASLAIGSVEDNLVSSKS